MPRLKTLYPDPFPYLDYRRYAYAMGVASGDVIWTAGQIADKYDTEAGRMVVEGDLNAQVRMVYDKIALILDSGGLGLKDVVHVVEYITPAAMESYQQSMEARRHYFNDQLPATSTIVVNRLLRPNSLIEVEAVAIGGNSPRRANSIGPALPGKLPTPSVVEKGDMVFLGTQVSMDGESGQLVAPGDVVGQASKIYQNMSELLYAAGATPRDVVKTVDYIHESALSRYKDTAQVRRDFFGDEVPASTGVIAQDMLIPGAMLEVWAIAVKNSEPSRRYTSGWPNIGRLTFRPGVRKGDLLCLSGMAGTDPTSGSIEVGDLVAQTQRIYEKAEVVLTEAGMSMANVVQTVDYVTPEALPNYRYTGDIRKRFFADRFPAATGIIVKRLLRPEYLIEIDFTAVAE